MVICVTAASNFLIWEVQRTGVGAQSPILIIYSQIFQKTYVFFACDKINFNYFNRSLNVIVSVFTLFSVSLFRIIINRSIQTILTTMHKIPFFLIITTLITCSSCSQTLTTQQSWIYGFLVGLGISLMGFVAALLLVCIRSLISPQSFLYFVNLLYSLGCGAIIGDAVIHILPDAYKEQQADSKLVSLIFILAVLFFLIIQRLFEALGIVHHHWGEEKDHHGHNHAHQHQHQHRDRQAHHADNCQRIQQAARQIQEEHHQQVQQISLQGLKGKQPAGYLNLLSSFIHNFFDGFAIGVGFATKDPHVYIPVMIAIISHEIPRQMGDVGILMKSGFTSVQTILCNGVVNFMSLAGLFPGLALGGISSVAQNYIMTFVAGNFIYVGADIWRNLLKNKLWYENIIELVMFFIGVGAMFLVLFLEESQQGKK